MIHRADIGQIGSMIATNTVLFSALDLGQWIADKFALWSLPANILAAVIVALLALAVTAAARVRHEYCSRLGASQFQPPHANSHNRWRGAEAEKLDLKCVFRARR